MQRERLVGGVVSGVGLLLLRQGSRRAGWTKPDVKPGALQCSASGWWVGLYLVLGCRVCGRGHAVSA